MDPPGPGGYMDGARPYFLRIGQSAGPIRSKPCTPSRAACRQQSSRFISRANTPRVTPCFSRPLRAWGALGPLCARAAGAANIGRKSRRRIDSPRRAEEHAIMRHRGATVRAALRYTRRGEARNQSLEIVLANGWRGVRPNHEQRLRLYRYA